MLTLQVPAGSYVINSKAVLAKAGAQTPVQCFLGAGGDEDRSLEAVDAANNTTVSNLLVHTFTGASAVTLGCDNPGGDAAAGHRQGDHGHPVAAISSSTLRNALRLGPGPAGPAPAGCVTRSLLG